MKNRVLVVRYPNNQTNGLITTKVTRRKDISLVLFATALGFFAVGQFAVKNEKKYPTNFT